MISTDKIKNELSCLADTLRNYDLENIDPKTSKTFFARLSSLPLNPTHQSLVRKWLIHPIEQQIFNQCAAKIYRRVEPLRTLMKKQRAYNSIKQNLRMNTEACSPTKDTRQKLKKEIAELTEKCDKENLCGYQDSLNEIQGDPTKHRDDLRKLFFVANTRSHKFYKELNAAINKMQLGTPSTTLEEFKAKKSDS